MTCPWHPDHPRVHREQFHLKQQSGVRWDDPARAARAVTKLRWDDQVAGAADFHTLHALIPTANHLPGAECELERLAAIFAAIKLGTCLAVLVQPAGVVHRYPLPSHCRRTATDLGVGDL